MRARVIPLRPRERGKRGRELSCMLEEKKKKGRDEKWMINEWLCSPEGLSSAADEELTGKSQLGTGLFHLFAFSVFIPVPHRQFLEFLSLHRPFVLFLSLFPTVTRLFDSFSAFSTCYSSILHLHSTLGPIPIPPLGPTPPFVVAVWGSYRDQGLALI